MPTMASPSASRFFRGNDLVGERNLRIGRRQIRIGRSQTMNLRGLRLVSDPGFECIELMLEVRERLLQISQFFRAGISMHTILPGRCAKGWRARVSDGSATRQSSLTVERPPFGGPHSKQCDVLLDLGQANLALILASIGQEANAGKAQDHHGPGRCFRHR